MNKLIYCALALALTTASAHAQTTAPAAGSSTRVLTSLSNEAMTVTHWYKQSVYDPSDSKIGEVMDVLLERDGKVSALIVGVGGFLGMGEKDVAVPFNAVQFKTKDNNKWYAVMNATKDQLKAAPGYKYDRTNMVWVLDAPATTGTQPRPTNNR